MCCRCWCLVQPVCGTLCWNQGWVCCLGRQVVGLVGLFRGRGGADCWCVADAEWVFFVIGLLRIFRGYGRLRLRRWASGPFGCRGDRRGLILWKVAGSSFASCLPATSIFSFLRLLANESFELEAFGFWGRAIESWECSACLVIFGPTWAHSSYPAASAHLLAWDSSFQRLHHQAISSTYSIRSILTLSYWDGLDFCPAILQYDFLSLLSNQSSIKFECHSAAPAMMTNQLQAIFSDLLLSYSKNVVNCWNHFALGSF